MQILQIGAKSPLKVSLAVGDELLTLDGYPVPSPLALASIEANAEGKTNVAYEARHLGKLVSGRVAVLPLRLEGIPAMPAADAKLFTTNLELIRANKIPGAAKALLARGQAGSGLIGAWFRLAGAYWSGVAGNLDLAATESQRAATDFLAAGDPRAAAEAYRGAMSWLDGRGRSADTLSVVRAREAVCRDNKLRVELRHSLRWVGLVAPGAGKGAEGITALDEAESMYGPTPADVREVLQVRNLKVAALLSLDRRAEAERLHSSIISQMEREFPNDIALQKVIYTAGAQLAAAKGDKVGARAMWQKTYEICMRQPKEQAYIIQVCLGQLAGLARESNDLSGAANYLEKALEQIRQRPNLIEPDYSIFKFYSDLMRDLGNQTVAEEYLAKWEAHQLKGGDPSSTLLAQAGRATQAKQYDLAARLIESALEAAERVSGKKSARYASGLQFRADLHAQKGEASDAIADIRQSVAIQRDLKVPTIQYAVSLKVLADRLAASGSKADLAEALGFHEASMQVLEQTREGIHSAAGRQAFQEEQVGYVPYQLIGFYMARGMNGEALATIERIRSKSAMDFLYEQRSSALATLPRPLQDRLAAVEKKRDEALKGINDESNRAASLATLQSAEVEQEILDRQIRDALPRYSAMTSPETISAPEIQRLLEPGTLVLTYVVYPDRLVIFRTTRDFIATATVPVTKQKLQATIAAFREAASNRRASIDEVRRLGLEVSKLLIEPVAAEVRQAGRLVICAESPVTLVPFAALPGLKSAYLGIEKGICTTPSMTLYRLLADEKRTTAKASLKVAGIGNPAYVVTQTKPADAIELDLRGGVVLNRLPNTQTELDALSQLYGSSGAYLTGADATVKSLLDVAPKAQILHLACHGLAKPLQPLASWLALTPTPESDGLLLASTIAGKLKLIADLVVLSACQTGLGNETKTEGVEGLTRSFLFAGARSVVSSFWSVDDRSTSVLMKAFYREVSAGIPIDEALRRARVSVLEARDIAHPYYWAAFGITGYPVKVK